jgi:glycosyltransferase involved in cell wall biosynthesis
MRVVLFTDTLADLNGVSRFIQDMARCARDAGDSLTVLTSTHKETPRADNLINLPPKRTLPMPYYPEMRICLPDRRALFQAADQLNPDLIHLSTPGPVGLAGRAYAKARGLPVVGTYHTDFSAFVYKNSRLKLLKQITDRLMGRFHRPFSWLITRSERYRMIIDRDIAFSSQQVFTLPAGTRTSDFHPRWRDRTLWGRYAQMRPHALKALFVGRIGMDKNVPFLLKAWATYQREYARKDRPVDLVLIGEGRLLKQAEWWRPFHAHFLGPVTGEALLGHYASADFFVFPSVTDTLGQVVMEAQASGLPVIVSDEGGPQTLLNLKGQPTGLIASADQCDAWVEAIRKLVDDEALREQMGQAAHESMQTLPIERSYEAFWQLHCRTNTQAPQE